MSSTGNTNPGNFANRPKEEVQEIASKGGQSRGTRSSGGSADTTETSASTGNTNPGNFANRPREEVQEIASKGGQASSGSFEAGSEKAKEAGRKGGSAS
jgi:general stress protein YciG